MAKVKAVVTAKSVSEFTDGLKKIIKKKGKKSVEEDSSFIIVKASIKDDFCHYDYEVTSGIGIGDTHSVKGQGIIDDDLREAFSKLNVHLAVIDDAFKYSKIDIEDIDKEHGHDITVCYHVTGFEIKGSRDNESIVLKGTKYVGTTNGRMEIKTPKIPLDNLSSYKWYNELKASSDLVRSEVELYKGGKYTAVEKEELEADNRQLSIVDAMDEDYFENAKV